MEAGDKSSSGRRDIKFKISFERGAISEYDKFVSFSLIPSITKLHV